MPERPHGGTMYAVTCATHNYRPALTLLLSSLRYSNPLANTKVYAIDWPAASLTQARTAFPKCDFVDIKTGIVSNAARRPDVLRLKPKFVADAYQQHAPDATLWIDADTIVLKPIDALVARVAKLHGDVGCTYRGPSRPHAAFAAGVIYIARTLKGAQFLKIFTDVSQVTPGQGGWFHDQFGLVAAQQQVQPVIVSWNGLEHSLKGDLNAVCVSRRIRFELPAMRAALLARSIPITELA